LLQCADCKGTPNGDATLDACGICGGNNSTCADCLHVPNGNATYDICGVCNGDGTTCEIDDYCAALSTCNSCNVLVGMLPL